MNQSKLDVLNQMEQRLHNLRGTFPCGIRKIDDERDEKIKQLTNWIAEFREKYGLNKRSTES